MDMTKGYTLSYFLGLFSTVRSRSLPNTDAVYNFVSPRFGFYSTRALVLDTWLGGSTKQIVNGTGRFANYGRTPRARLIKALRNRKVTGSV
jgi:hypothetical protein